MKPRILLNIDEVDVLIEYNMNFALSLEKYKPNDKWKINAENRKKRVKFLYEILNKYWPK